MEINARLIQRFTKHKFWILDQLFYSVSFVLCILFLCILYPVFRMPYILCIMYPIAVDPVFLLSCVSCILFLCILYPGYPLSCASYRASYRFLYPFINYIMYPVYLYLICSLCRLVQYCGRVGVGRRDSIFYGEIYSLSLSGSSSRISGFIYLHLNSLL